MTHRPTSRKATIAALAGALALAGCTEPGATGGMFSSEPRTLRVIDETQTAAAVPQQTPPTGEAAVPQQAPPAGDVDMAARAENACVTAGEGQGFRVIDIVGGRATRDDAGFLTGRDVMLRVERGAQRFEVRCSYAADADSARIMTL